MNIVKAGISLMTAVTVNEIFQIQKQIGNRRAFLVAVSVAALVSAEAQCFGEAGDFYICGAGEGA